MGGGNHMVFSNACRRKKEKKKRKKKLCVKMKRTGKKLFTWIARSISFRVLRRCTHTRIMKCSQRQANWNERKAENPYKHRRVLCFYYARKGDK